MATVKQMLERLMIYQDQIMQIAQQAFEINAEAAADLNASQLARGLKTDGEQSDYPYSPLTVALKKGRPGLSGVTAYLTNYNTGASYRGLYARIEGMRIAYGTTTAQEEHINDRMDGLAFGLTDDSRAILVNEYLRPSYGNLVREIIKAA